MEEKGKIFVLHKGMVIVSLILITLAIIVRSWIPIFGVFTMILGYVFSYHSMKFYNPIKFPLRDSGSEKMLKLEMVDKASEMVIDKDSVKKGKEALQGDFERENIPYTYEIIKGMELGLGIGKKAITEKEMEGMRTLSSASKIVEKMLEEFKEQVKNG